MHRVENKYACNEMELVLLQSKLKAVLHKDGNQENANGYKVTSVYFDSYDDACLRDAIEGIRFRKKFRIRIYNNSFTTIKLEVKHKANSFMLKDSCTISYQQMLDLLHGKCIAGGDGSLENPITLFNMAIRTSKLSPCIIVEYDRKAFVFRDGNVRITLDSGIRFSTDFDGFIQGNSCRYKILSCNNCVLEVKYDEFLPGFIGRLLENGNMNQVSYSKYRLCREWQKEG